MPQKTGRIHRGRDDEGSHLRASQWPINDLIDNAYGAKYQGSLYLSSMIGARVRSATVKN
jgi:hypothetical protein